MKKKIKIFRNVVMALVIVVVAILLFYTIREFRPAPVSSISVSEGSVTETDRILSKGDSFRVISWNTGYAGLGWQEDFFMDGGSKVRPDSKEVVLENLEGITATLLDLKADILFLQEVDVDSRRTYHVNELDWYEQALGMDGIYGCNYKCDFVPYPLPPLGKIDAGQVTMSSYPVKEASRISLPESFSWPVKTCNLKRCMLETRIPVSGTDQELVLINFHLEAYDNNEGKAAQSAVLASKLREEYEKGNYVIAGGDFNQTFEGIDKYEIHDQENWIPGIYAAKDIPEGFSIQAADNVPSCRLLNAPYSGNYEESQVYVIDGFIVSDNLIIDQIENIDTGFVYADHQPVVLDVRLQ